MLFQYHSYPMKEDKRYGDGFSTTTEEVSKLHGQENYQNYSTFIY